MAKFALVAKMFITGTAMLSQLILRCLSWFNGVQIGAHHESFIKRYRLCSISILFDAVHHEHALIALAIAIPLAVSIAGGM